MIYKTVLMEKWLQEQDSDASCELLDPIVAHLTEQAEENLQRLGAIDPNSGLLTAEGKLMLSLGVDIRLNRFLIACAHLGCLASGVRLASVLMMNASDRLFPSMKNTRQPLTTLQRALIDTSGDHLTLLNIMNGFLKAKRSGCESKWCRVVRVEQELLQEAYMTYQHILRVLETNQFSISDEIEGENIRHGILKALSIAYSDQLAVLRQPGCVKKGFIRVLDDHQAKVSQEMTRLFAERTSPKGILPIFHHEDVLVQLSRSSTLWLHDVFERKCGIEDRVVFQSILLADGCGDVISTMHLVSYIPLMNMLENELDYCRLDAWVDVESETPAVWL